MWKPLLLTLALTLSTSAQDGKPAAPEVVEGNAKDAPIHERGAGRVVSVFDPQKKYNTTTVPHLGPEDAPHVIVKYFDYTCSTCLSLHQQLGRFFKNHPKKFCLMVLPVPLNRDCNPHFPENQPPHPGACELTRLSLAAWKADPKLFPKVHELLFTRPILTPETAEIGVAQIVGEEKLAKALKDPWVEGMLKANLNDLGKLVKQSVAMPKLLVSKGRMLHGPPPSERLLIYSLEQEFKLKE